MKRKAECEGGATNQGMPGNASNHERDKKELFPGAFKGSRALQTDLRLLAFGTMREYISLVLSLPLHGTFVVVALGN